MVSVNVKGGFWGDLGASFVLASGHNTIKRRIARLFNRPSMRGYRELALELNGAAAGEAAEATHKQVLARENTAGELGGLRTVETVVDVDRNTTAADETDIDENILAYPLEPSTYAVNGDGNPREFPGG